MEQSKKGEWVAVTTKALADPSRSSGAEGPKMRNGGWTFAPPPGPVMGPG